jgi:hypothetical protein
MINELTKKHTDAVNEQIKVSIDYHFDQLVVKPYLEISKLPESVFIQAFLPFFSGERNIDEQPEILINWIAIAGNPTKEVQVVDDSGTVLFTVPPIMDTTCIDYKNDGKGQSIANIIANYELHKGQLPVVGKNYLDGTLDNRMRTLTKNSDVLSTNENRWNSIFIKYGKIKDTSVQEDKSGHLSDDEIEYD